MGDLLDLIEKLERQPVHGGNIEISWMTRDEILDELRKAAARLSAWGGYYAADAEPAED